MSLLEFAISHALVIWFFFYLWNHADISKAARDYTYPRLFPFVASLLQCAFCTTFWITTILWFLGYAFGALIILAPPIALFIELTFRHLCTRAAEEYK